MLMSPASTFRSDSADTLPCHLALLPGEIRQSDGLYRVRGMRTGRVLAHRSALLVAVAASLQWNPGLLDAVTVDEALAQGGPDYAEAILERLAGDAAPDLLIRLEAGGREMTQAVTVCADRDLRSLSFREDVRSIRETCRAHGLAWGLITDAAFDYHRASTALWLCAAVERGAPAAAVEAVRKSLADSTRGDTLADVLFSAAIAAGVPISTAADAFGFLVASRESHVDIDGGSIMTGVPLVARSRTWPSEVHDAWTSAVLGAAENPASLALA